MLLITKYVFVRNILHFYLNAVNISLLSACIVFDEFG